MCLTPEGETVLQLYKVQNQLLRRIDSAMMVHGISNTEFMVLFHLSQSKQHSLRRIDLAKKVGLSASGVTRLLKPMQKIGLVEKEASARDARVSLVKLTRGGKRIFSEAETSFNQSANSFLEPLNARQRQALSALGQP